MARVRKAAPLARASTAEIGVSGLKVFSGYVHEEFHPKLKGRQALRVFREMSENDATIGAALHAIGLMMRAAKWEVEPPEDADKEAAEAEVEFVQSLMADMSHSWSDFMAEVMTMLIYGWAYHEIVWKRRIGPDQTDPAKRSKFTDGRIGVRKLAPRSQDTLDHWQMQDDGGINGMWQRPHDGGIIRFLPITKSLLFRTTSRKNSPEGLSTLRNAYLYWHQAKEIEYVEGNAIRRDLGGMPIVRLPAKILTSTDPADMATKAQYERMSRDMWFNEQASAMIPSETYMGDDGKPSTVPLVSLELLASPGQRMIDIDVTVQRKQRAILRAMGCDFAMLGEGSGNARGSYGMHESKLDLFVRTCEAVLKQISEPLNRFLLPRVWELNGLDQALMPTLVPGRLEPTKINEIATFLKDMSAAGATVFPDETLENYLRSEAHLPEKTEEVIAEQEAAQQAEMDRAMAEFEAQAAARQPPPGQRPPVGKAQWAPRLAA